MGDTSSQPLFEPASDQAIDPTTGLPIPIPPALTGGLGDLAPSLPWWAWVAIGGVAFLVVRKVLV